MAIRLSVILPVFNAEDYIYESIESILNQTFSDFELIIINDASSDNSESIINKFNDARIRYFKNETNLGIIRSLNYGLELAKGEYIARMDADDISFSDRFYDQISFLDENSDVNVVGSWVLAFNNISGYTERWLLPSTIDSFNFDLFISADPRIAHPASMFRKICVLEVGGYDINLDRSGVEDADLWFRLFSNGNRIVNIPKFLLKYRIHNSQLTNNRSDFGRKCFNLAYKKLLDSTLKVDLDLDLIDQLTSKAFFSRLRSFNFYFKLLIILTHNNILSPKFFVNNLYKVIIKTFKI